MGYICTNIGKIKISQAMFVKELNHLIDITEEKNIAKNLQHWLNCQEQAVLIDFYAHWCTPCLGMMPSIEKLAISNKDTLIIVKINIDTYVGLAQAFKIMGVPTFILFHRGKIKYKQAGIFTYQQLNEIVQKQILLN